MANELRTQLWNVLTLCYWDYWDRGSSPWLRDDVLTYDERLSRYCKTLWVTYFVLALDVLPHDWDSILKQIRKYFMECPWNEVYDFVEFTANNYPDAGLNRSFVDLCNKLLESEVAGYRFVGTVITPITSETEISAIEDALSSPLQPVSAHLKRALELLSDRKQPDYRDSIKESISAVEALCKLATDSQSATLGATLNTLQSRLGLHQAFRNALSNLYGYTSDADGIRHALHDLPNLEFDDAKFMLVTCSAFVNYLTAKCAKAGITLGA